MQKLHNVCFDIIKCLSSAAADRFPSAAPRAHTIIPLGSPKLSSQCHYDAISNTHNIFKIKM